jgi:transitional endoplasmic reticulum ATPase
VKRSGGGGFEVQAATENRTLDDEIGGLHDVKKVLRQAIEWPLMYAHKLKAMGVRPSRGVLLYGAPGCGKTTMVRAVASASGMGFLKANGAELFSAFLGESERILRQLFARARALQPCVLFLDEIDAIVGKRSLEGGSDGAEAGGVQQRVLSTVLNELDGIDSGEGVVLVGATNRLDMIDAALLRPGRFDHLVHVPLPDVEGRRDILKISSRSMPLAEDVDLHVIAAATHDFTGAELSRLCQEAGLMALRQDVGTHCICASHFEAALKNLASNRLSIVS